jgi:ectoine hydroxylase-related dioxygenase (phytanoyl-CoA dioxygenase family)
VDKFNSKVILGAMASSTDGSLRTAFAADGAVLVRGLFDGVWLEVLRRVADEILDDTTNPTDRLAGAAEAPARSADGIWRDRADFARVLRSSPIADVAADALGSASITLYEDLFLYTEPAQEGAPWHRDAPHWPLMGEQLAAVWFSLEPVPLGAGALHFLAGSHHDDREVVAGEAMTMGRDDDAGGRRVLAFATEPGDAIVFHPRILHTAKGAAADRPRRTFTVRVAGDDIRWRPRSSYFHAWMREAGLARGDRLEHPWFPVLRQLDAGRSTDDRV